MTRTSRMVIAGLLYACALGLAIAANSHSDPADKTAEDALTAEAANSR